MNDRRATDRWATVLRWTGAAIRWGPVPPWPADDDRDALAYYYERRADDLEDIAHAAYLTTTPARPSHPLRPDIAAWFDRWGAWREPATDPAE